VQTKCSQTTHTHITHKCRLTTILHLSAICKQHVQNIGATFVIYCCNNVQQLHCHYLVLISPYTGWLKITYHNRQQATPPQPAVLVKQYFKLLHPHNSPIQMLCNVSTAP